MTHLTSLVAGRINDQPLLVNPKYREFAEDIAAALDTSVQHQHDHALDVAAVYNISPSRQDSKPFVYANGVAFIPISGTLINRFNGAWGFVTGYGAIRNMFDAAVADNDVKAIVFDVNSNGGEAQGCFELSSHIAANKGDKKTLAVVDANCYSAAYALASAADKITVTPSGGAGSIGVVTMHANYKGMLDNAGIEVTFIYAGDHKVDGNPYQPLSDSAKADIQMRIDSKYDQFVALVAENRGMDESAVRDTQARCFDAQAALDAGLIDAVAPPPDALAAFLTELSGSNPDQEIETMSQTTTAPGAQNADTPDTETAKAEGRREAQERIKAINALPEAAKRSALANHLALNTELSVEDAQGILAASPEQAAVATGFEQAMNASGGANVGADASATEVDPESPEAQAAAIVASYAMATGRKLVTK